MTPLEIVLLVSAIVWIVGTLIEMNGDIRDLQNEIEHMLKNPKK